MSPRPFNRIMVDLEAGGNAKLGRLNDAEFRCFITGILPIAAKSPVRGRLLVSGYKVEPADVARQARMTVAAARKTLQKLRDVGILEVDELHGCEVVHDFEDWNPAPKIDRTNAERQRRYRDRLRNGDNAVVTLGKGSRSEEKTPPYPPKGGNAPGRKRDRTTFDADVAAYTAEHFPDLPAREATHAVRQALTYGQATTLTEIRAWIAAHFPDLHHQLPEDQP